MTIVATNWFAQCLTTMTRGGLSKGWFLIHPVFLDLFGMIALMFSLQSGIVPMFHPNKKLTVLQAWRFFHDSSRLLKYSSSATSVLITADSEVAKIMDQKPRAWSLPLSFKKGDRDFPRPKCPKNVIKPLRWALGLRTKGHTRFGPVGGKSSTESARSSSSWLGRGLDIVVYITVEGMGL